MSDASSRTLPRSQTRHVPWRLIGYGTFVVAAVFVAYWRAFASFPPYDDEGYVLLSLREFLRLGGLYNHVYTQYGPFPYELWGAVYQILGIQVTPDSARMIVIAIWVLGSVLVGLASERVTRSLVAGLIATIAAFSCLGVIVNEVLIPDDLTTLLALLLIAASALAANRPRLRLALIGMCVGAMVMTKINIGGAVLLASCLAVCAASQGLFSRRQLTRVFIGLGVLVPVIVARPDLASGWAENLVIAVSLGILAVGAASDRRRFSGHAGAGVPEEIWFLVALVVTVVVLAVVILILGTTPAELIHGIVIGPLGQRNAFTEPATLPAAAVDLSFIGVIGAFVSRRGVADILGPLATGLARVLIGVLILLWAASILPFVPNPDLTTLGVALPFAWLAAAPPSSSEPRQWLTRLLMAAVPTYAAIGIYPVAGSQTSYAATIFVPAAVVIMADGVAQLRGWAAQQISSPGRARALGSVRLVGLGLLAVFGYQLLLQGGISAGNAYAGSTPLKVSGATRLRLPTATADTYTALTNTLRSRCDQFVTLPGMDSFYLWSNRIPPTGDNVTSWMFLLNDAQQQRVVDRVQRVHRLCLVENLTELGNWEEGRAPPARPLYQFVTAPDFKQIYAAGGYTIALRSR